MKKFTFLIFAMLFNFSFPTASADGYSIKDLEALISSKQFAEACQHLTDIGPTQRDATWQSAAEKSVLGRNEQLRTSDSTCNDAWYHLEESADSIPILKDKPAFKAALVSTGICYLKLGQFWDKDGKDKVGKKILAVDPSSVYELKMSANWEIDYGFLRYLSKNADKYKNDPKVKKYMLDIGETTYWNQPKDINPIKFDLLKKYDLYGTLISNQKKRVMEVSKEMIQGSYGNSSDGQKAMKILEETKEDTDAVRAAYYLPAALCTNKQGELLTNLKKISASEIAKVEKLLIAAHPENSFWFCGSWEPSEIKTMATIAPKILATAKQECQTYKKTDDDKSAPHVNTSRCKDLP